MRKYWFLALFSATCLEGLGRKYLPFVPSMVFYFLKDLVLLAGYLVFRPPANVRRTAKLLYSGFGGVWGIAVLWTFLQVFNPSQQSFLLAVIGLRSYWLWWMAPLVVAGVLQDSAQRRRAINTLAYMAIGIAILAAAQFAAPADSAINLNTVIDGEARYAADMSIVSETGRARVSSTFAFLSGFADFTILVPALLLSLGLEASDRKMRRLALSATLISAAVLPMAGSRSSVLLGIGVLVLTCWTTGLFFTVVGRRIMIGALAGTILATVAFPDAILGVQKRFDPEETKERLILNTMFFPPVALIALDYPMMGIGTGMQQNARVAMKVEAEWASEIEVHRYLVELGPIGFLMVWGTKFGLVVALMRSYRIFMRAKRRAAASAALSYAAVTFFGNITFDHIWQALYFIGCGFILAETVKELEKAKALAQQRAAAAERPAIRGALAPAEVGLRP